MGCQAARRRRVSWLVEPGGDVQQLVVGEHGGRDQEFEALASLGARLRKPASANNRTMPTAAQPEP